MYLADLGQFAKFGRGRLGIRKERLSLSMTISMMQRMQWKISMGSMLEAGILLHSTTVPKDCSLSNNPHPILMAIYNDDIYN
jgi:hypothetical protein